MLRRFFLFNGFTAYPSGQAWTYHEPDIQVQHAVMFEEFGDRFAGHILWQNLKYLDESMRAERIRSGQIRTRSSADSRSKVSV